jgi:hypothetical protein
MLCSDDGDFVSMGDTATSECMDCDDWEEFTDYSAVTLRKEMENAM